MHDELTREDIRKMQEELDYRRLELMPGLIEEVKRTRAFGDLSENFEYKAAKQAQNKNRSRIRYLEGMIKTAKIIEDRSGGDTVGLFDEVTIYLPEDDETEVIRVVTTVRCDPRKGLISRESPFGKQVLGKKVGDRLEFGGLLGYAPVMPVNECAGTVFARRGGRIPAPLNSLKN
jgi:transcription elongation factor GreA